MSKRIAIRVDESGFAVGDGRLHVLSGLMRESLVDESVMARTDSSGELAVLPDVTLVGIGGRSIFDRGRSALLPLAAEIASLRRRYKMVIGVGGGTRARHTIAVAADLGLPVGGIAQLVGAMEEANAVFLNALLAKHGSMVMQREHYWELPLYLECGMLPIVISIPPYHFWEPPPEVGPQPAHGSDFGLFVHAETLGMRRLVFVKDQDGLYDDDPVRHLGSRRILCTSLEEVLASEGDLILDRALFEAWRHARHVEEVQIVNGLKTGELTRAMAGKPAGTTIVRGGTP